MVRGGRLGPYAHAVPWVWVRGHSLACAQWRVREEETDCGGSWGEARHHTPKERLVLFVPAVLLASRAPNPAILSVASGHSLINATWTQLGNPRLVHFTIAPDPVRCAVVSSVLVSLGCLHEFLAFFVMLVSRLHMCPNLPSNDGTTFDSQSTYVLPYTRADGTTLYIYCGDRWNANGPGGLMNSTYIWLPFNVSNGQWSLEWHDSWVIGDF
jgi:hypothetical protein